MATSIKKQSKEQQRGRIALLLPRDDMADLAHNVLQEKQYDVSRVSVVKTEEAVSEARTAAAAGASLIIARGLQASLIQYHTSIPVVELVVTAQEMGLLMVRAREIIHKPVPVIGVVGLPNMFSDMSYFNEIYEVELRTYFAPKNSMLEQCALDAAEDGVDLIIGGAVAARVAAEHNIPSLFPHMTEDSLRRALNVAEQMLLAVDREWDSGRLNAAGTSEHRERIWGETPGASEITFRKPVVHKEAGFRRPALARFADIPAESARMQDCVELARMMALTDVPVWMQGEAGTEKLLLAQSMHNGGRRSDGSFVMYSCLSTPEEQNAWLFVENGLVRQASGGTLYLQGIEHLGMWQQYALYQVLRFHELPEFPSEKWEKDRSRPTPVNIRIIAESAPDADLVQLAEQGKFLPELAALLSGMCLDVPPLRERPEDLHFYLEQKLREADKRLGTYHKIPKAVWNCLLTFPWNGNRLQIESFTQRLVMVSHSASLQEAQVRELYETLYGAEMSDSHSDHGCSTVSCENAAMFQAPYAERDAASVRVASEYAGICLQERQLRAALAECGGSRRQTAKMLGISETTVWRRMKKYHLG